MLRALKADLLFITVHTKNVMVFPHTMKPFGSAERTLTLEKKKNYFQKLRLTKTSHHVLNRPPATRCNEGTDPKVPMEVTGEYVHYITSYSNATFPTCITHAGCVTRVIERELDCQTMMPESNTSLQLCNSTRQMSR